MARPAESARTTISAESVRYSVPHELVNDRVWVRFYGERADRHRDGRGQCVRDHPATYARPVHGSPTGATPMPRAASAHRSRRTQPRPSPWR
ncbi:hypothetical protein ACFYOK_38275 [Microbispora bryophytorum]|uniref:Mu transposase domain-containing protein n=1 Tax=Microbispora bryophytorum TaxID=1460882 RepID=UPI0036880013